jgi:hypothetical protein
MFCPYCGKAIQEGIANCPYCGASISSTVPPPPPTPPSIPPPTPPPYPKEEDLDVGEVLESSFNIIRKKPVLLLPQIISTVMFTLLSVLLLALISQGSLVTFLLLLVGIIILGIVVGFAIEGMYPLMVKNVIEREEVDMLGAFQKAVSRLPSLIGSGILVGLIVGVGLFLLVVPGIIFLTWYYYTVPSIMLEERGALEGMSASRKFGRTRKLKTFTMLLVLFVVGVIGRVLGLIPIFGIVISAVIELFVAVWGSIIPAYAYIEYAMI